MILTFLKTKLHRAKVTQTDIDYNGSISIDKDLMEKAGIYEYERVEIYNINNGQRFNTYAIEAKRGSKTIGINGAAARLVQKGDLVIICAYAMLDQKDIKNGFKPNVLLLDNNNNIVEQT